MSVLQMTTFDAVLGVDDYVEKLKDTMLAYGWTLHDFLQNVQWQNGTGFVAGDESFLQMSTTGFGSQTVFVRIRTLTDSGDVLNKNLQVGMHKTNVFSTATPTHPVLQGNWNTLTDSSTSYSPNSIPMLWIFGNDKFIHTVAQHNNTQVVHQTFGVMFENDPSMTEGEFCAINSSTLQKWYTGNQRFPMDGIVDFFYDGQLKSTTNNGADRSFRVNGNSTLNEDFGHSAEGLENSNDFSERRLIDSQIFYIQDTDGQYFDHSRCDVARCFTGDLPIGHELVFGTKKYVTFPNADNAGSTIGVAVRIQ